MDSITRLSQKVLAERARNGQPQRSTPPEPVPPPPYSEDSDNDEGGGMESDDEDDEDRQSSGNPSPLRLTINAAHNVQGCNNLVPTSATPLADATKFSTILMHAVNQINNGIAATHHAAMTAATKQQRGRRRRHVKIDMTINCGITVVGDRNVIGNVALKPKAPNAVAPSTTAAVVGSDTASTPAAVVGAKRKADDAPINYSSGCEPTCKKVATLED